MILGIDLFQYRMVKIMSGERSPTPVSQERYRNEEKDSLANRKQESQSRVTKRMKKSRKRKVSTSGEDSDSSSTDSPAKKEKETQTSATSSTDVVIFLNCQRFKYR